MLGVPANRIQSLLLCCTVCEISLPIEISYSILSVTQLLFLFSEADIGLDFRPYLYPGPSPLTGDSYLVSGSDTDP